SESRPALPAAFDEPGHTEMDLVRADIGNIELAATPVEQRLAGWMARVSHDLEKLLEAGHTTDIFKPGTAFTDLGYLALGSAGLNKPWLKVKTVMQFAGAA